MGGRDAVLAEARRSYGAEEWQFTAELTTYLIRVDVDDTEARALKAAAFRRLGYAQINPTWRGFYLTGALYLEGAITDVLDQTFQFMGQQRGRPGVVGGLPPSVLVEQLPVRLRGEDVADLQLTVELEFTDVDEIWSVEIRRGIAETRSGRDSTTRHVPSVDAAVRGPRTALGPLLLGAVGCRSRARPPRPGARRRALRPRQASSSPSTTSSAPTRRSSCADDRPAQPGGRPGGGRSEVGLSPPS